MSECGGETTEKLLTSQPSLAATYESSVRGGGGGKNRGEEEGRNHSGYSASCMH